MLKTILKSKIHRATVTETRVDYVGSITIDKKLMDASGLVEHEKVLVCNIDNAERFETYVIEGGDKAIELNGAAAKLADKGDKVIIMAFGLYDEGEECDVKIIVVDDDNTPTSR